MYEINGVCYAGGSLEEARIVDATPLQGGMLLVQFVSGERRLFDTTTVEGNAFELLRAGQAQDTVKVEHGIITWLDGGIDIAPEYVYAHSLPYDELDVLQLAC